MKKKKALLETQDKGIEIAVMMYKNKDGSYSLRKPEDMTEEDFFTFVFSVLICSKRGYFKEQKDE